VVSAGRGKKFKAVKAKLRGLKPGTLYHYRIVATNKRGTGVGRDRTFRTGGAKRHGSLLRLAVADRSLRDSLHRGLRVRFTCSGPCEVALAVTPTLSTLVEGLPVVLARATGRLPHAGSAVLTLRLRGRGLLAACQRGLIIQGLSLADDDVWTNPVALGVSLR
jgi:hypothetical protein